MKRIVIALLLISCACVARDSDRPTRLSSIQLVDRNGFSETISTPDRLSAYLKKDFIQPQPYAKIIRYYGKKSIITTYHDNGQIAEYLEVFGGRASGHYYEWHPSGSVKLVAILIEGMGDVSEEAKESWVFDDVSRVWDEKEVLLAEITYDKGRLEGESRFYRPDGSLWRTVPYVQGEIDGAITLYTPAGNVVGVEQYRRGVREGLTRHDGDRSSPRFEEEYANGKLMSGYYYDFEDVLIAYVDEGNGEQALFQDGHLTAIKEVKQGFISGVVREFASDGSLVSTHSIKQGAKHGTEEVYYPGTSQRRLSLEWRDGLLHGVVKTWYEGGGQESEREMYKNKRHGLSLAWYLDGNVMHIEEYENDLLVKGSYMKPGEKKPTSSVEEGKGVATLFDSEGYLIERVVYEHGRPALQ